METVKRNAVQGEDIITTTEVRGHFSKHQQLKVKTDLGFISPGVVAVEGCFRQIHPHEYEVLVERRGSK